MIILSLIGWSILFVIAVAFTFFAPWLIVLATSFGYNRWQWLAIIPLVGGCAAIWALCHYAPFHIVLG